MATITSHYFPRGFRQSGSCQGGRDKKQRKGLSHHGSPSPGTGALRPSLGWSAGADGMAPLTQNLFFLIQQYIDYKIQT